MLENRNSWEKAPLKARILADQVNSNPISGMTDHAMQQLNAEAKKEEKKEKELFDEMRAYAYDPTLVGVGGHQPTMSDEEWIRAAVYTLTKEQVDLYFRGLLDNLRKRLGGIPLATPRNRNDKCICGSGRRFGRCCGKSVEEGDPDTCKSGGHLWGHWARTHGTNWIRKCADCTAIDSVQTGLDIGCEEEEVVVIPCSQCKIMADGGAGFEIYTRLKKSICVICGKNLRIKLVTIEHLKDGKHVPEWHSSYECWQEDVFTFDMKDLIGEFHLHSQCLRNRGIPVQAKA